MLNATTLTPLVVSFLLIGASAGQAQDVDRALSPTEVSQPTHLAVDGIVHPTLAVGPVSMYEGNQGTITIYVNQAGSTSTQINLSSSDTSEITVPSSVTIPAGATYVQAIATATTTGTGSASVTASANNGQATTAQIAVMSPAP